MREILRASLISSGGFLAAMLLGAATVKILATLLGPAGMGLFALLRQTHQTSVTLASFGGQNTLAQGIASRRDAGGVGAYVLYLGLALLGTGLLLAVGMLLLSPLAVHLFPTSMALHAPGLARWLVVPILLGLLLVFLNGLLTAWRDVTGLSIAQFVDAVIMLLLAWPAAKLVQMDHPEALVALMATALFGGVLVGALRARIRGYLAEVRSAWRTGPRVLNLREVLAFPLSALAVSGIGTATLLAVRALLSRHLTLASGGLFDTAWSLSQMYVWILLASLTTWYLPTLARMDQASERGALIARFLRYAVGVTTPAVIGLSVLKPLVVRLLFSEDFLPAIGLWRWLLLSDYLRATSWVLAMAAFARGDMRPYLGAELVWNLGFLASAFLAIRMGSLEPVGVGLLVLHVGYLAWFLRYARRRHAFRPDVSLVVRWGLGLAGLGLAARLCWDDRFVGALDVLICLSLAGLSLALAPTRGEWTRMRDQVVRFVRGRSA
ncbi:MAG: oligosaccharide flippase family protein [Deltaproteobacteria bacterium]|nr:oligosaccharide flippase family protein [Deltaproteobacteria bacterium]